MKKPTFWAVIVRKCAAMGLILVMLISLLPVMPVDKAQAASSRPADLNITVGPTALIGNLSHAADNAMINFYQKTPGFTTVRDTGGNRIIWDTGDDHGHKTTIQTNDSVLELKIEVAKNDQLRNLAKSGHATVNVGWTLLIYHYKFIGGSRTSSMDISMDGATILHGDADGGNIYTRDASAVIKENSVITISVSGEKDDLDPTGVEGFYIKFEDKTRPVMTGYTFTGNGAERLNKKIPPDGQQELYAKENENITLTYNFSEPVTPTYFEKPSTLKEGLLKHPLFVNPLGTGLPAAGEQQYLKNTTFPTLADLGNYAKDIKFQYVASKYHQSGNPLKPRIVGTTNALNPIDESMEEKFEDAVFADGAGNVADIAFPGKASNASNVHVQGKTIDPFDFDHGGYRVIVDAVAPKYTKTGNGITPDILTGTVMNNGDSVDFILKLTEEATVKTGWDVNKTFLYFDNGMKAYYVSGSGTDTWRFRMPIPAGKSVETPLLKVIALTHDNKAGITDGSVLQDYAGNMLIQPANFLGVHVDGDKSNVNSKIDWADLSIDNTEPVIGFRFEQDGASDSIYRKSGKVTVDANDPPLKMGSKDPNAAEQGLAKPSKGIYRPSNMTGASSPSVGLVYYTWSRSAIDPFADKAGDYFAAVKRYSLSAKQPREELYPGEYADLDLKVANNKTGMIAPPPAALTDTGSGDWYLHVWTADMSWDSARELMQYNKMRSYIQDHPAEYEAWKAAASGSDADKTTAANKKALEKVGQYGDTAIWELSNFKQNDSNWSYQKTVVKYDNRPPSIAQSGVSGDNTANVQVSMNVTDEHSGVADVWYQWVKQEEGHEVGPQEINWIPATLNNGILTVGTEREVPVDGQYKLYVKAIDRAGNERIAGTAKAVTVNSAERVSGSFDPAPNTSYVQSHDILFHLSGIVPDEVNVDLPGLSAMAMADLDDPEDSSDSSDSPDPSNLPDSSDSPDPSNLPDSPDSTDSPDSSDLPDSSDMTNMMTATVTSATYAIYYAYSTDSMYPTDDRAYSAAYAYQFDDLSGDTSYRIPADTSRNGMQYIHVKVKAANEERYYYFNQMYYFDNQPPEVTFSMNGVPYPMPSHEVTVTVTEPYSAAGLVQKYQWVKDGDTEPDENSANWVDLPSDGKTRIDNKGLSAGEVADFRLYVLAVDGAANSVVTGTTGYFRVTAAGGADEPPATGKPDLIYVYGDDEDGYTAIVKLSLEVADKTGYSYSISPDNGTSWVKWRPYTNFVAVKVASGNPNDMHIKVKYRSAGGVIGPESTLDAGTVAADQPVYALATHSATKPVSAADGVKLDIAAPPGIKIAPSTANPSNPVRSGNTFNVKANGLYTFELTDTADPDRKDTLVVVVSNIDTTPPQGTIEYLTTKPTNGNVTVRLHTSEPVKITSDPDGQSTHTFTVNGTFTFTFEDEAGNTGSAPAVVTNIDKEGPDVKIVRSYTYGDTSSKTFGTIRDGNGNVLLSSGVTLEVQKASPSAKDFIVPNNKPLVSVQQNGTVSFIVQDMWGNTTVVKEDVREVISAPPQVDKVDYTFVDETGNPLPANKIVSIGGVPYARGQVKVTLSGRIAAPNAAFVGMAPIDQDGAYANQISRADGAFTYSKIYSVNGSTLIAISDLVGNVNQVPVKVAGLDNTPPEIKLNEPVVGIARNKADFDFRTDLGGFTVSDNVSAAPDITVTISGLNLSQTGQQTVTYTAKDQVGNTATAVQKVIVLDADGMMIYGNGTLISPSVGETALFDDNTVTFNITGFNRMSVGGQKLTNEAGVYDLLYQPGLYREGQMKYIASKITYKELLDGRFTVTFPKAGWYTLIVRTQEREREYATFFVGKTK